MATTFDTLKFVEHLEAGGFTHQQAKATAEAFAEAANQELATKTDIFGLRSEMLLMKQRMTVKFGSMMIAAVGLIIAAIRYLPTNH